MLFNQSKTRHNNSLNVNSLEKLTLSDLFEIIDQLWYRIRDQQIIVLTTNHNQRDPYHTALLSPLNIDACMHTSSPQPIALPDGGEIEQLDSSEHKPLVDFDATNNRAYQSSVLVSNSETENMRETSKRQCMTESVLSSDDSRTRISLTDFVAPDYRVDLVRAYQNGSIMFTSDNKDTREGLNGECLTESVLSDDDLTKQELLPESTSLTFSELTSEDIDGFYDSISVDSDSDDFDDGAGMLPDLKDEFVDGLSSSCGDERITVSTTNHRDPPDAALLPLVDMETDIHTASPQLIALPDGGEIVQLESIEQKPLVDFDATNNRAYQSGVLVSSKKKNVVEAYKGQWECLIQRTKKDMGEGSNKECLTKGALSLDDSTERNSIDARQRRGRLHSMEHEQPATFAELGTDPENESIVYDLLRNRSLIAIKDFDHWVGMLPNLKNEQFRLSGLLEIIHGLLSSYGDERIIILTTNHNHIDRVDAALLRPLIIDLCLHTSSPQPMAVADGAEIVQLDSSEQKPLEDFDATSNRAYQSNILVCNSEGKSTREASRRQCIPESVLSLVDSMTRISSTDFYAPNCSAHLERADQSGPIVFNLETKDSREGLNRECLTTSVLSLDDSSRQKSLPDVDATKNKAHLVRAYQKGLVVSLSKNKNRGEALKREYISRSVLGLGDLQQHFGGRRDDAAKNFGDSLALKSFEVLDSLSLGKHSNNIRHLAWWRTLTHKHCVQLKKSQDLPRSLLSDYSGTLAAQFAIGLPDGGHIPSLSKKIVKNTLKRKSRTMSVLSLEDHRQHVGRRRGDDANYSGAKHICRQLAVDGESTAKCIRRQHGTSRWPFKQSVVGLPDGGYMLSLSKKKIVRKTFKRKCRNMSVLSLEYHWKVDSKWEDSVKSIEAKHIYRQLVIHFVSRVKRIHRQHGFHRWPFQQNWATRKGQSLGDERPSEFMSLSADGKLISRLQRIHVSWLGRFSPWPSALRGAAEIVGPTALSSSEFAATNRAHRVGQDQSSPTASHSKKKRTREQEDPEEINTSVTLNDLRQHYGRKRKDAAESLGVSVSTLKRICRQHGIKRWPNLIRKKVWRPPDPHGETNPSPTCETLSTNGQIEMENDPAPSQAMPTIPQTMGSSNDWRNLLASQEEPFLEGHVLGSFNWGVASCYDLVMSQPMTTIPHTMGSLDDSRNLLASQEEPFLEKDFFGFVDGAVTSCYDPALSQPMPTILHTMGSSIDWRNLVTSQQEPFLQGDVSGSINWIVPTSSYPALSQPMSTITRTMPEIPLTENEDMGSVELKATYGDTIIKFQLRPMFGISELKEEVSKRREFELGSYKIEYKDAEGDWTLIACNDDIRRYLQQLKSFGKQVIELRVRDEAPNTTNSCEFCGSLMRERP
ncbi:hypothetical protein Vadar_031841 [Vaccinium darrowii]|uniref:Uncharacterized protein n=1 Tax=Vaccinium darrowii TaxID=229202 RepID=A0ACB7YIM9_9ERIC|nr:hypothetical protein Vadar_031841 [Vaccinium darrowii]